jgi:hypothetical protein
VAEITELSTPERTGADLDGRAVPSVFRENRIPQLREGRVDAGADDHPDNRMSITVNARLVAERLELRS